MFGEGVASGFIPTSVIDLRAGNLYNVVISLLVFLGCAYAAWSIYARGRKAVPERSFSFFLGAMAAYWLLAAVGNLFAWMNFSTGTALLAYPVKALSPLPAVVLLYYFSSEIFNSKTSIRRFTFLYVLVAAAYVVTTLWLDSAQTFTSYWGLQWQVSILPLTIYVFGLLLPLTFMGIFLILRDLFSGAREKRAVNLTLHLSAIIFVLTDYLQVSYAVVTWQRLLARLFYILIAFGAYLFFVRHIEEDRFLPRETELPEQKMKRVPFFAKLLFLFIVLAVIPITISSLLMFVSFKEIIDVYVYKPLLWNLKTSREAFLLALNHVQIQALFLMLLTGLLVFVASVLASRAIAESLRGISAGMERVSRGDFSFKLRQESNDEIGDVVAYFNEMSSEIKRSREIMQNWNRELEVKVAERTQDLRMLYNVAKAIGSSLDLELLIDRAIGQLLLVVKGEVCAVLVPDESGVYSSRIGRGVKLEGVVVEEGKGLLGEALKKKGSVTSENVPRDPRCQEDAYRTFGAKTMIVTPLQAKGRTMGLLAIGTRGDHKYTERESTLLATISDQLAIAIENIGIYEKEKEAVARLTELDRLKNEFISMVSHELRTPVTSVDGYISLFLTGSVGPLTEDQKKYLTIVRENDQRLLTLIDRLLDFSRIETGRFKIERKLTSVHDVIQAAVADLKPQIETKQAKVKMDLRAQHSNIMADAAKLESVMVNLIENALKFAPEEGTPLIEVRTRDAADFIRVEVADNGLGVEKKNLEMIFNKFYQIEDTMTRRAGGVGLGLALVKEIIGNHHGKVWAESGGRGRGTRFVFEIPVAEKA